MPELISVIILISLLIVLFPYLRFFIKRLSLSGKLSAISKNGDVTVHKNHWAWLFSANTAEVCDIFVETCDTVYSVKLFFIKRRLSELFVNDSGGYFVRAHYSGFGRIPIMSFDGKYKKFPSYNFKYKYDPAFDGKKFIPVLLLNPSCYQVRKDTPENPLINLLESNESVNGFLILSFQQFNNLISKKGKTL